jgi:orotate phosphoribosyltransferase
MIPKGPTVSRFNFPDFFIYPDTEKILASLQYDLQAPGVTDIILNFEKCHWFDIFPLAQLLAILFSAEDKGPTLHIVGPSIDILPYFYPYVANAKKRLNNPTLSDEEREAAERIINWYSVALPQLRLSAGSFLIRWGVWDLIEEHWENCRWYKSRESKSISINALREIYFLKYTQSTSSSAVHDSDTVWPFTTITRSDEADIVDRVNGEELVAGALKKYARTDVIADGTAQNVLFFEPFENIFEHGYKDSTGEKIGILAIRIADWMYDADQNLISTARWLASKSPGWEGKYFETLKFRDGAFMEIVLADCGQGIPSALGDILKDDTKYRNDQSINNEIFSNLIESSWEAIKYAFESHSTSKKQIPPGRRGLAWVKEKIEEIGGLVQVVSNGACYVLTNTVNGFVEMPFDQTLSKKIDPKKLNRYLRGTFIRIAFPIEKRMTTALDRRPRWNRYHPDPSLFTETIDLIPKLILIPSHLTKNASLDSWNKFFDYLEVELTKNVNALFVLDFAHQGVAKASLEYLFDSFIIHDQLRGKIIVINCSRQMACRLDTITSVLTLKEKNLVVPVFETNLRLYWAGADQETEKSLLKWFQDGPPRRQRKRVSDELKNIALTNRGYFILENNLPADLSFSIESIEELVRESLGQLLKRSLKNRGALNVGRYVMPLTEKTVTAFVEPHQLFADSKLSHLLCSHLAILLRWRFGPLAARTKEQRVLTATRIGRDIAMRMPEAYPHKKTFIYFDYHLVQPDKPRLLKHLKGSVVVIVVDIITTGSQVEELIKLCEDAECNILGIISFIDFSPGERSEVRPFKVASKDIEHKTFLRMPQFVTEVQRGDKRVDKETFSLSPPPEFEKETPRENFAYFDRDRGLRFLEDAEAVHFGHYELFGHHFDFVVNFSRLLTNPSYQREEILRICEKTILNRNANENSTAIVLYPDLSNAHILQGSLEKRHRLKKLTATEKLMFVEARRGARARGRKYWLTNDEIKKLTEWAHLTYGENYSVMVLDDEATSGETLIALLDLARELKPKDVTVFVLVNQMPHVMTYHHQEIERFVWATNKFFCLLHLNIPAFARENCPMCHERELLLRDYRSARSDWFRQYLEQCLQRLELITTLHPQDTPEEPLASPFQDALGETVVLDPKNPNEPFFWEDSKALPGNRASIISRALSVRIAINDGVPLMNVLEEVSKYDSDELWNLTAIEVARRADLHIVQRAETEIKRFFSNVLRGRPSHRRLATLEALRYMRPESLLPEIESVIGAALGSDFDSEFAAAFLLLMRRVFYYRHLPTSMAFEKELAFSRALDHLIAGRTPESPMHKILEYLIYEWGNGPEPRFDLISIIVHLERILMTTRRRDHRLLYELSRYISDRRTNIDDGVRSALDQAVRAMSLAKTMVSILKDTNNLSEESLLDDAPKAYYEARELRRIVEQHMRGVAHKEYRFFHEKLENLKDLIEKIEVELKSLILADPGTIIERLYEDFRNDLPPELKDVTLNVSIYNELGLNTNIIISEGTFHKIVRNLFSNLRHAIDGKKNTVKAKFLLRNKKGKKGAITSVTVTCYTGKTRDPHAHLEKTTSARILEEAELYGAERVLGEKNKSRAEELWTETWNFHGV